MRFTLGYFRSIFVTLTISSGVMNPVLKKYIYLLSYNECLLQKLR